MEMRFVCADRARARCLNIHTGPANGFSGLWDGRCVSFGTLLVDKIARLAKPTNDLDLPASAAVRLRRVARIVRAPPQKNKTGAGARTACVSRLGLW